MKYLWFIFFLFFINQLYAQDFALNDSIESIILKSELKNPHEIILEGKNSDKIIKLQNFTNQLNSNRLWWILIALFTIFTFTYLVNQHYSKSLLMSLSSIHVVNKMARSRNNIGVFSGYIYMLLFCAIVSIALNQALITTNGIKVTKEAFFFILLVFFISEIFFIELTGFILKNKSLVYKVRFNNTAILFGSLILLFHIAYLLVFSHISIKIFTSYIVLLILGLIIVYKEYRTYRFIFAEKKSIGFFHFFLYICTFKITPFIILVKVLMNIV